MATADLFERPPRRPARKLMKLCDAGSFPDGRKAIHFVCARCGHDDGWSYQTETNSQAKVGRPCPKCN